MQVYRVPGPWLLHWFVPLPNNFQGPLSSFSVCLPPSHSFFLSPPFFLLRCWLHRRLLESTPPLCPLLVGFASLPAFLERLWSGQILRLVSVLTQSMYDVFCWRNSPWKSLCPPVMWFLFFSCFWLSTWIFDHLPCFIHLIFLCLYSSGRWLTVFWFP